MAWTILLAWVGGSTAIIAPPDHLTSSYTRRFAVRTFRAALGSVSAGPARAVSIALRNHPAEAAAVSCCFNPANHHHGRHPTALGTVGPVERFW